MLTSFLWTDLCGRTIKNKYIFKDNQVDEKIVHGILASVVFLPVLPERLFLVPNDNGEGLKVPAVHDYKCQL